MTKVGAEILVVPDGLNDDGTLAHIALQVTPSLQSADVAELANWPSQIAERARHMTLLVGKISGGSVQEVDRIACTSALTAYHFTENEDGTHSPNRCLTMADQLWKKVFAVNTTLGFDQLFEALRDMHDDGSGALANAEVLPSRSADMQLFWKVQEEGSPEPLTRQPLANKLELWRKIAAWMEHGPSNAQRLYLNQRLVDLGPEDEGARQLALRQSFQALLYPTPAMSQATAAISEAAAAEMFHGYMRGLQRPRPGGASASVPNEPNDEDDWQTRPVEIAGRKLSTLLSFPSLATYLGLGVEIAVERQRLLAKADRYGNKLALAIVFTTPSGNPLLTAERLAWTACSLDSSAEAAFFTPRAQGRTSAVPLLRGLVKTGAKIGAGQHRFRLETGDVANMTMDRVHAVRYGDPAIFADVDEVKRIAGFVVYDSMASAELKEELALEQAWLVDDIGDKLNWAEDLLRGLRPDFALSSVPAEDPLDPENLVWRSISGREIHCEDAEFDPVFRTLGPVRRMLHRDHGMTQVPVERIDPPTGSSSPKQVQKIDEMFIWQGENIGIPRNLQEPDDDTELQPLNSADRPGREGILSDPERDLGLRIRQSLPSEAALKMMPMREWRAYAVAMRGVFANGVSLPLDAAVVRYSSSAEFGDLVLGGEDGTAVILPPEDAASPGVHLHWKDALVQANDLRLEAPGESVTTIVVRDGHVPAGFGKAGRFITPPRAPFDLAEKQGQFDLVTDSVPPGALSGSDGLWRFGSDGAFPEARFGRLGGAVRYLKDGEQLQFVSGLGYGPSENTVHLTDERTFGPNQSRGTVAILGPQQGKPGRFYPHKHARQIEAHLESLTYRDKWGEKTSSLSGPGDAIGPEYRVFWNGDDPSDARPLFLELLTATDGARFSNNESRWIDGVSGFPVRLPTLEVELGKGETWQVTLNAYDEINAEPQRGKQAIVRVVHAVKKPLAKIGFAGRIDVATGNVEPEGNVASAPSTSLRLGLNAVTVSVSEAEDANPDTPPTWEQHVSAMSGQDMLDWDSQEGGDTTFIVGRLALDRKSTGDLRVEAEWENYDGETVTWQNGKWIKNPSRLRATLMAIDIERSGHPAGADLLQKGQFFDGTLHPGTLRGQTYAVPKDGQLAREYLVKLVTGTAFKDFYADGQTETKTSDEFLLKKKCTFRPPPPRLAEIETRLHWSEIDEPKTRGRRRSSRLRIRLDEKWFVSGKGEKLGIVLQRPGSPILTSSRFAPYLSVAGADPTMMTSPVPEFLYAANFPAVGQQEQDLFEKVDLFLPEQVEGGSMRDTRPPNSMVEGQDKLSVDVLVLTPQFSESEGLYCDVEVRVDPNEKFNPYNAFVHFGLVRFQENAVKHLRASFPLKDPKTKVYLLPDRELRVKRRNSDSERTLELTGSGYELAELTDHARSLPVLDATLMRWSDESARWMAVSKIVDQKPPSPAHDRGFLWREDFLLESSLLPYVILVEEFERLPLDTGDVDQGKDDINGLRLVYSCMIKL